jgi:hypothetical protein
MSPCTTAISVDISDTFIRPVQVRPAAHACGACVGAQASEVQTLALAA